MDTTHVSRRALGVIPRVVANGRAIYRGKLTMDEARLRIDTYWRPYHSRLKSLLAESHDKFGRAILVDCHSMPHEAVAMASAARSKRPEIVLGDRFGASASPILLTGLRPLLPRRVSTSRGMRHLPGRM